MIALGVMLLFGMVADEIGHRTRLPRVTLLIIVGFVAGPSGFDALPGGLLNWSDFLANLALSVVAFLLGGRLTAKSLAKNGTAILILSVTVVVVTAVVVTSGFIAFGVPLGMAMVLAAMATATDPAATQDVVHQAAADGPFTDRLLGIVAVDDLWGILVFALVLVAANTVDGTAVEGAFSRALWEILGAVGLGVAVGLPAAWLTGRISPGDPTLSEALGVVFLTTGLAIWFHVSFLLAGIVAGSVVANFARHHARPFHEVEHIEWPFMILFFMLAGASLDTGDLGAVSFVAVLYLVLRIVARLMGGSIGGWLAGYPVTERRWVGAALMPQAGVAIGMALVAGEQLPNYGGELLTVAIATTVVFELIGPVLTQIALQKVGEAGNADQSP